MIEKVPVTGWREACEHAAKLLQSIPAGPLAADLVVLPSAAHRRSFSQYLAGRPDGPQISAGIELVTWRVFIEQFRGDTWQGETLTLAICDVLDDPAHAEALAPLRRHLGAPGSRPGRRYATAQRLARVLRRYAAQAPQMVSAWRDGHDTDPDGEPLAPAQRWQPDLWRAVRALLGGDPAEHYRQRLDELAAGPDRELPRRIVLVALDDPDDAGRDLIDALGHHHEVHLICAEGIPVDTTRAGSAFLRHHASRRPGENMPGDSTPAGAPRSGSLLHQVQYELRHDLPAAPRQFADQSLQIHACHGPDRQVEVLRDALCGLFTDDPSLQPRDVVVLCTSIAEYAPLVEASFCLDPGAGFHPGHRLRVQLAHSSVSSFNPVLAVLAELLSLYTERATSVDLLDFCQLPPVAHRFGFDADDIERLRELIAAAQIRWGVDAEQRRRNGLAIRQSTWLAGVQRMLISLALADEPPVVLGTSAPLAQVQGSDAELIGQLAELISRVRKISQPFATAAPAHVWVDRLREAIELLTSTEFEDSWQLSHALGELADLGEQAAGRRGLLDIGDIACWLDSRRHSASRRPNYGNGSLLVTDLDDLAGIEARVICVLGLDDAHFPGPAGFDGDDLLRGPGRRAAHWTTDRRAVRRQRLLDAVLAAQDALVVITQGADQSSGSVRPVPVCIAELMEACAIQGPSGQWRAPGSDALPGDALVRWHPLHPHGWQDFTISGDEQVSSFDRQGLLGARALQTPPAPGVPHWQLHHPAAAPTEVDVEQLIAFFVNPARTLLREATGTTRSSFERELQTSLPIAPDHLAVWSVGNELFEALSAGHDADLTRRKVWLSGQVLPGQAGARVLDSQLADAQIVARSVRAAHAGEPFLADCQLDLPAVRLQGRIQLFDRRVVVKRFGFPKPDDALTCWIRLLLAAADPGPDLAQVGGLLIGKRCYQLTAPPASQARQLLSDLVAVRAEGLHQILPLPLRTGAAYTDLLNWKSGEPLSRAHQAYADEDANWQYFFADFDELHAARPGRFEQLCDQVIAPIKDHLNPWRPGGTDCDE